MLVLTRKVGEEVVVDHEIRIVVLGIVGNGVKLGIEAPKDIPVHRLEIYEKIFGKPEPIVKPRA